MPNPTTWQSVGNSQGVKLEEGRKAFNAERQLRLEERKEPVGSFCKKRPDGRKNSGSGGKSFSPWCK